MSVLPGMPTHTSEKGVIAESVSPPVTDVGVPPPGNVAGHVVVSRSPAGPPLRPTSRRADASLVVGVAAGRIVVPSPRDHRRRHYPPRLHFLEDSRMEREMLRL